MQIVLASFGIMSLVFAGCASTPASEESTEESTEPAVEEAAEEAAEEATVEVSGDGEATVTVEAETAAE